MANARTRYSRDRVASTTRKSDLSYPENGREGRGIAAEARGVLAAYAKSAVGGHAASSKHTKPETDLPYYIIYSSHYISYSDGDRLWT